MTSIDPPDYEMSLVLSTADRARLAGKFVNARTRCAGSKQPPSILLMIPENEANTGKSTVSADMWVNSGDTALPIGVEIGIELLEIETVLSHCATPDMKNIEISLSTVGVIERRYADNRTSG